MRSSLTHICSQTCCFSKQFILYLFLFVISFVFVSLSAFFYFSLYNWRVFTFILMMFSVLPFLIWFSSLLLSISRDIRMRLPVKSHLSLSFLLSHSPRTYCTRITFLILSNIIRVLLDRHYCLDILWWNVSNKIRKCEVLLVWLWNRRMSLLFLF